MLAAKMDELHADIRAIALSIGFKHRETFRFPNWVSMLTPYLHTPLGFSEAYNLVFRVFAYNPFLYLINLFFLTGRK